MLRKKIMEKLIKNRKGQSLVETAVVMPLLLFILFGMIMIGIYIYNQSVILLSTNRALDTGIGMLNNTEFDQSDIEEKIEEVAENFVEVGIFLEEPTDELAQSIKFVESGSSSSERELIVTVSRKFNCGLPFVESILGDEIIIKSETKYIYYNGD